MSRYQIAKGVEAEFESGSGQRVLRNLRGIKRKREMDQAEYIALTKAQTRYYAEVVDARMRFNAAFIRRMHYDWLGELYAWAGNYRTVEMSKDGIGWPPAFRIADNMEMLSAHALQQFTPCRSAPLREVCRQIAEIHAVLVFIHPFRDGNGRVARWLADLMAAQAGYPPPMYRFDGRGSLAIQKQYLLAMRAGYVRCYEPLSAFFEEAITLRLSS